MERRSFIRTSALAGLSIPAARLLTWEDVSRYLTLEPSLNGLRFDFFSIDSLGKGQLSQNISLGRHDGQPAWKGSIHRKRNIIRYHFPGVRKPAWEIEMRNKSVRLTSHFCKEGNDPFIIAFNQHENHATLLGRLKENTPEVGLPAVLHMPDMGTLRISANIPGHSVVYSSKRFIEYPFVRIDFPAATSGQGKLVYDLEVTSLFPKVSLPIEDEKYDCFRRNFISIFQLNPFLGILANNSASDACAFTLFKYSEVARHTPALTGNLQAMDLIGATLDRYLNGTLGYGMLGYDYDKTWNIPESSTKCDTLDSYPSLIIAACNYILHTKNRDWYRKNEKKLDAWIDKMKKADKDGDGLNEFCLSGNSGSWKGDSTMRPANWWDTIGFGHKDAYSNALVYRAWTKLEKVAAAFGITEKATAYAYHAAILKKNYVPTFFNEPTGILAGWKSADGNLHDYWFTFVNAIAICYGLVETDLANQIMDRILAKMKEVGYTDFGLGLPGNLIPVIRADYTDLKPEVGGGKREDNLDGFQIYENGGATACYTYFTITALQKLGRTEDADLILEPLLKSMSSGGFQGRCPETGRTRDWKTWKGECWGYEGFLVDNYLFLLCVLNKDGKDTLAL